MKGFVLSILLWFGGILFSQEIKLDLYKTYSSHKSETRKAIFVNENEDVLSGDIDGKLFIWSIDGGDKLELKGHKNEIIEIMTVSGDIVLTADKKGKLIWWNTSIKETENEFSIEGEIFSETDELVFIDTFNHETYYLGTKSGKIIQFYKKTNKLELFLNIGVEITSGGLSHDGKHIVISEGSSVNFINLEGKHVVRSIKTRNGEGVNYFHFNPKESEFAMWSASGSIELANPSVGVYQRKSDAGSGVDGKLCFSPDGKFMVTGNSFNTFRVWQKEGMSILIEMRKHKGRVVNFEFSNNGEYLLTCSEDKTVRVWETSLSEGVEELEDSEFSFEYKEDEMISVDERTVEIVQEVVFQQENLTIQIKDNRYVDGDVSTLLLNEKIILEDYTLTSELEEVSCKLDKGKTYVFTLYATDMGKNPPNNAEIIVSDGISSYKIQLSSSLKACQSIKITIK